MEIQEGTSAFVTHDIVIENQFAFGKGEQVFVEAVTPNQQRPEYRYVVTSPYLQKRFQLSDAELMMPAVPPPAYEAPNCAFSPDWTLNLILSGHFRSAATLAPHSVS